MVACSPEIKNPELMVRLDALQYETGLGLSDLDKAIRSSPKEAGLYKLRSRLQLEHKQYTAALESIDEALKLQPEQGEYHYIRARALRALGNAGEALASARKALEFRFSNSDVHVLLGEIYLTLQDEREALRHLNEALNLYPENGYAYYYKGLALAASGDTLKSLSHLNRSLQEVGAFTPAYTALARLHHAGKAYDSARQLLKKALALEPRNGQLWYLTGLAFEGLAQPDSAFLCYRKASTYAPELQGEAAYRQASIAYSRRDYSTAITYLLPVLDGDHNHAAVRWMLAESYEKKGQWREALSHYQVLKDNDPADRKAYATYWQLHQRLNMPRPTPPTIDLIENRNPFTIR
jgi:tetratricopeptide (TPR) repeat protein